ncbi:MAG: inositol monophosphatase [Anaerolineales bacterium]|nr:inositol monophosphatase [Anaerolineales bacterium]
MVNDLDLNQLSQKLIGIAKESAIDVGSYLISTFEKGVDSSNRKAGFFDPVTEADRVAESMIVGHILRSYPDSTIIGEESGHRGNGAVEWYIDPIDGTNNFIDGIPVFCVSIAAAAYGSLLAAVVYDPIRREMLSATLEGAFLNGKRIRSSGNSSDETAVLLTGYPYEGGRASEADHEFFRALLRSFRSVRRLGPSALELAYVACGRADVSFQTNANSWDVAAGMMLVEKAGGRYFAIRSTNTDSNIQPWKVPKFIATCPQFDLERSCMRELLQSGIVV